MINIPRAWARADIVFVSCTFLDTREGMGKQHHVILYRYQGEMVYRIQKPDA